jgi:hypothetical protein
VQAPIPVPRHEPGYFLRRDAAAERSADAIAAGREAAPADRASPAQAPTALGLGSGAPLGAALRSDLEGRMGADLSTIRVHRQSPVPARLGARAFAAGRDIALGPDAGSETLDHEVAHSLQQAAQGPAVQLEDKPAAEQEKKAKEGEDALLGGVKVVVEELQKNKEVQKTIIEPAKAQATRVWKGMPTGEQAGVVAFGALTYGTLLAGGLSSPEGRQLFEGANLALPLTLVPYMPITGFEYKLGTSPTTPNEYKLSLGADDLLKLATEKTGWFPPMKIALDLGFADSPDGGLKFKKGKVKIKLFEGIELQAGQGIGLPPPLLFAPDGGVMQSMRSIPSVPGMEPTLGSGAFLSIDFVTAPILPERARMFLGGMPKKK